MTPPGQARPAQNVDTITECGSKWLVCSVALAAVGEVLHLLRNTRAKCA